MSITANQPMVRAFFNNERARRKEKRVYCAPETNLSVIDKLIVGIVNDDIIPVNETVSKEIERQLTAATGTFFQLSDYVGVEVFNVSALVALEPSGDKINVYILDKLTNDIRIKSFMVDIPEYNQEFITGPLDKETYLEASSALNKTVTMLYSDALSPLEHVLYHVVFQTELDTSDFTDHTGETIKNDLLDTEFILHLNITNTVKLYGAVDDENFLNISIREIGTPEKFWTRSVLLSGLLDSSLRQ